MNVTYLKEFISRYKIETAMMGISLLSGLIAVAIYLNALATTTTHESEIQFEDIPPSKNTTTKMYVDVSGSVMKPDMYEVSTGARLKDALGMAGGLSQEADRPFFSRHYNLAKKLMDEEKIYVPSQYEIAMQIVDTSTLLSPQNHIQSENTQGININSASLDELDSLPGVGKVTGQKIIDNRPYESIEDLTNRKIVSNNIFEQIKDLIVY